LNYILRSIIWLDNQRNPFDPKKEWLKRYNIPYRDGEDEIQWARTYDEFTELLRTNGVPDMVSFDHDLDPPDKTHDGFDCAVFLCRFCQDNNQPLPKMYHFQTANPRERQVMIELIHAFERGEDVDTVLEKLKVFKPQKLTTRKAEPYPAYQQFKESRNVSCLLTEELRPVDMKILKGAMRKDKSLESFLTTQARELPSNYRYLVQDISDFEDYTLYDIIYWSAFQPNLKRFISFVGDKPIGFVAYEETDNSIEEIKMFSFNPKQSSGTLLLRDLNNLIKQFINEGYDYVKWSAYPGNPAIKIYDRVIDKYNGKVENRGDRLRYIITNPNLKERKFTINVQESTLL